MVVSRILRRSTYRMYVDEVGDHHMRAFRDDGQRYLSLTGVIMRQDYAGSTLSPDFDLLKAEYFSDHHPDHPVIFHRSDMVRKRGSFRVLGDPDVNSKFSVELLQTIRDADFKVITAGINKESHTKHYVDPAHPYHYLLEVLVERYVWYLESVGARGDILVEARNSEQNNELNREYQEFYEAGNNLISSRRVQRRLTSKKILFKRKDQNVGGLQLVDMVAFPSHRYLVCEEQNRMHDNGFSAQIVEILLSGKYRRSDEGKIVGYGTKWLR